VPFKSKAQERFMYAKHPELAKEFQATTPNDASLPERAGRPTKSQSTRKRRTSTRDYDRGMLHSSDINQQPK
jgi:hypothetical protein